MIWVTTINHSLSFLYFVRLVSGLHSLEMSAAIRGSLRAFANPATALRQTATPSITGNPLFLFGNTVPSASNASKVSTTRSLARHLDARRLVATSKRSFTTRSSHLLSAQSTSPGSNGLISGSGRLQRKVVKYLIALGIVGLGAVAYFDELKHAYGAARRSGRVVGTLAVCINE